MANGANTHSVIISCATFSCAADMPALNPSLFAGTMMQYSKKAIIQLVRIITGTVLPDDARELRCQYQAVVINILPSTIMHSVNRILIAA